MTNPAIQMVDTPAAPADRKSLKLRLSHQARTRLSQLAEPLQVELELLFSCLVRKRVNFNDKAHSDGIEMSCDEANVQIHFRPVVNRSCAIEEVHGEQEKIAIEVKKPAAFMPRWLALDFRGGHWVGEFGW